MKTELFHTAPVSSKGQITLPVNIRQMLGIKKSHRIIGIYRRGKAIELAKIRVLKVPIHFTPGEHKKPDKISRRKGKRRFRPAGKLKKRLKTRL